MQQVSYTVSLHCLHIGIVTVHLILSLTKHTFSLQVENKFLRPSSLRNVVYFNYFNHHQTMDNVHEVYHPRKVFSLSYLPTIFPF
jgi:hypothetical protein